MIANALLNIDQHWPGIQGHELFPSEAYFFLCFKDCLIKNVGDMEILQHLNFDIKIFLFQKYDIYSKTKRIDYLLRQCDDLWVAFHQSESINWAVGEKIALVFFFNFMLQFVCQSYQRKMNIELQVQIQTKNSKINVKIYMYNKKVVFFPSQEFPTHSCPHGRWADPKSLTLEDVNNEESSYYYQRQ